MKSERESLRNDVEHLADGPDKEAMLKPVAQLDRLDREAAQLEPKVRSTGLGSTVPERIFSALCFCALGYLLGVGIYHGRFPNFFVKRMPYVYWEDDPYVFSFIAVFLGVAALVFLCLALGIARVGRQK